MQTAACNTIRFAFLFSGVAALIYQVSWQRLLVLSMGGDVAALTLIVTSFMAGMGIGSWLGGKWADSMSSESNLVAFASAEAGVALFGTFSSKMLGRFMPEILAVISGWPVIEAGALFTILLVPTFLMGISLPMLSRALVTEDSTAASVVGGLYARNTVGAALGALLTTWYLLPTGGVHRAIWFAVACNIACAAAVGLGRYLFGWPKSQIHPQKPLDNEPPPSASTRMHCAGMFFLCGFVALASETVWFRFLGTLAKSSAHTWGTLLSIYLLALGVGASVATRYIDRIQRPWTLFLRLQSVATAWVGAGAALLLWGFTLAEPDSAVRSYLDTYEPVSANRWIELLFALWNAKLKESARLDCWVFPIFHFLIPAVLLGPSTFLMGAAFPLLQKAAQVRHETFGSQIGLFQTANMLGSIAGAAGTTFVLLPTIGTSGLFRLLFVLGIGIGVFSFRLSRRVQMGLLPGTLGVALCIPNPGDLWAICHGRTRSEIVFEENSSGVSLLKRQTDSNKVWVFVNGIGQSWIPYGGVHTLLGALPVLFHPHPESVALIGLGSGDTLFAMGARQETTRIRCAEIVDVQIRTLERIKTERGMEAVARALEDPRVRFFHGDGRRMLSQSEKYDVIEADALRPDSSHAGTLYSEEYFRLAGSRLKTGGLFVTWIPTQRVAETLALAFPHVTILGGVVGIGSFEKLDIQGDLWQARASQKSVQNHFQSGGVGMLALLSAFFEKGNIVQQIGPEFDRSQLRLKPNTDCFARDEWMLPSLWKATVSE
jgi:spermidine synthase